MAQGLQGNRIAYHRLLSEISISLARYFAVRLPASMVDDAVQDVLVSVHFKRHTYDPKRPFKPWLTAIARYKWIDRLRAIQRSRLEPLDEHDVSVADHGSTVASGIDLERLLGTLKPAQAGVIRLVKLQGFTIDEASKLTGQSPSLVKVNIHRGLARLSRAVECEL